MNRNPLTHCIYGRGPRTAHPSLSPRNSREITAQAPTGATQPAAVALTKRRMGKGAREQLKNDWPWLGRFKEADLALAPPLRAKTAWSSWATRSPRAGRSRADSFPGKPYINRGISGQTTPQMLVRFRQDVIALKPKVVVILAGHQRHCRQHRADDAGAD
jgi:acyl-CoA thioesterase I